MLMSELGDFTTRILLQKLIANKSSKSALLKFYCSSFDTKYDYVTLL